MLIIIDCFNLEIMYFFFFLLKAAGLWRLEIDDDFTSNRDSNSKKHQY